MNNIFSLNRGIPLYSVCSTPYPQPSSGRVGL